MLDEVTYDSYKLYDTFLYKMLFIVPIYFVLGFRIFTGVS
jgi:hypothetical protein